MKEIDFKIIEQIIITLEKLGANEEILSVVGSYKDTLTDEDVLHLLTNLNNDKSIFPDFNQN